MNQKEIILEYLKKRGSITPLEALSECGSMRLSERIRELKADGHAIRREMVSAVSKFTGHAVHYARYILL